MSRFKAQPKAKNNYPKILNYFEKRRQGFKGFKKPNNLNLQVKGLTVKMLQRFSGKLGK